MWNSVSIKAQELPLHTKKKKKKNEESTPIFRLEIMIEILSWLPVKSLLRGQLVCKEWRAVIQDHYFQEKHLARCSVFLYCFNVVCYGTGTSLPSGPEPDRFAFIHGCNGLLLLVKNISAKYIIWNPAIHLVLELPDPRSGSYGFAFCFGPASGKYKIVSIYKDKESGGYGCEVLTPGHSTNWRRLTFPDINTNEVLMVKRKVSVVSAGASVHCVVKVGKETVAQIVTLDVETECFTVNHLPDGLICDMKKVRELDWDGRLAFADIVGFNLQLVELEDYKRHKWK